MKARTPFSGKRVRQNSVKLENIAKRELRLNKIGLSLLSFAKTGSLENVATYEAMRKDQREKQVQV